MSLEFIFPVFCFLFLIILKGTYMHMTVTEYVIKSI
jgi:hypothetical protein